MDAKHNEQEGPLRQSVGFWGIFGQSIAGIAPTTTPTINVALAFAVAGTSTWAAFAAGMVVVILIALNLTPFAKKMSGAGSLAGYVGEVFGPGWSLVTGWAMLLAYLATTVAVLSAGAGYGVVVLEQAGMKVPLVALVLVGGVVCSVLALRNVRLSTGVMLGLEVFSIILIVLLCLAILKSEEALKHLFELRPEPISLGAVNGALLIAVLSFVGFEEAAALGKEAKNPLRSIPRVLLLTPVVTGLFFVVTSFVIVSGFNHHKINVTGSEAPLDDLARAIGRTDLGLVIASSAWVSLLGCALATLVAGSRIAFSLAERGALPKALGRIHPKLDTPRNAVLLAICVTVPLAIGFSLKADSLDIYDWFGTFATFGIMGAYGLTCAAAPIFLRRQGRLGMGGVVVALLGMAAVGYFLVVSVYPAQAAPLSWLPWIFAGLEVAGLGFSWWWMRRGVKGS